MTSAYLFTAQEGEEEFYQLCIGNELITAIYKSGEKDRFFRNVGTVFADKIFQNGNPRIKHTNGVKVDEKGRRGSSKLEEELVEALMKKISDNISLLQIEEMYGVNIPPTNRENN